MRTLQCEVGCDLNDCRAILFVSPSFVPLAVAQRMLDPQRAEQERLRRAARQLARRLGIPACRATGLNWFCSGYSRAMSQACHRIIPRLSLADDQFVLLVTASRISRITDYACKQTAGLFGDMATATLIAPSRSRKYPVHFDVLYAEAEKSPPIAPSSIFTFVITCHFPTPTVVRATPTSGSYSRSTAWALPTLPHVPCRAP